ncbi:hypothetical protein SALBM217S_00994 [Streptomyces griseoloalbus]
MINSKGHAVTTTFDPGRSLALTITDANGRVTRNEYDALGRLVKGWSPPRSSGGKSPDVEIGTSDFSSGSTLYLGATEVTADATGAIVRASRTYGQAGAPSVTRTDEQRSDHGPPAQRAAHRPPRHGEHGGLPVERPGWSPAGTSSPPRDPRDQAVGLAEQARLPGVGIDDMATGLTYIGAREYDQNSGRFLSADPASTSRTRSR